MKPDKKFLVADRVLGSISFNLLRSGTTFCTIVLLARWLGPHDYGVMVFLFASFVAFQQLFDMSSTSAFFTFLSGRPRHPKFITFYARWIVIQFGVSLLFVALILPDSAIDFIWQGESKALVVLAFVAAFMQNMSWTVVSQMGEACRETIAVQKINAVVAFGHFIVVVGLWIFGKLVLPLVLVAVIIEWSIACWVASSIYESSNSHLIDKEEKISVSATFAEFWDYCKYYIPFVWLCFIQDIASTWMLQRWGGAEEQAYYGIGLQFSAVLLIVTFSVLKIFWKEIAEAYHLGDLAKLEMIFFKASKALFLVGAVCSGFIIPWSNEIIVLVLGESYLGGVFAFSLMLIFPVHQSMGQLGNAMLMATQNIKSHVILGMIFSSIGFIVAFIMLSPSVGLGLAATGLAFKMVFVQFLAVNAKFWVISRIFGWKFNWASQLIILGSCLSLGLLCKYLVSNLLELDFIVLLAVSSSIYISIICLLIWSYPEKMTGFSSSEIVNFGSTLRRQDL